MTPHDLIAAFEAVAEAPEGVARLRELVLQLAVRGRLVPQDPADQPVERLCSQLRKGRDRLIAARVIAQPRHPAGVPVLDPPYDLPPSWAWVRVGDVGAVVGGGTPASGEPSYWADGVEIAWLTPADMRHQTSRYVTRGGRDITKRGLENSSAQLLPAGSVLFSSRAPIGHVGIAAGVLATNQGFKSCVPYVSEMSEYVYLFLREVGPEVDAAATGTTFKEVSGKDVALIPMPLPPLAEQRRIVARVDELMGLLDRLEAARTARDSTRTAVRDSVLHALREADTPEEVEVAWCRFAERMDDLISDPADIPPLRQTVLELAVRGRLVPQDPADEPAAVRLGSRAFVPDASARHMQLPAGWAWSTASRLGSQLGGGTPSKSRSEFWGGTLPWVTPKDMKRDLIADAEDHITEAAVHGSAVRRIPGGSLLMVVRGMILAHSFPTALTAREVTINQDMKALVPFDAELGRYLLLVMKGLRSVVLGNVERSTHGTCRLDTADVFDLPLPVAPWPEQRRIVARVDELMGLLDRLEARLSSARDTHAAFAAAAVHHLDA